MTTNKFQTTEDILAAVIGLVIAIPLTTGIVAGITLLNGWALSKLWAWFMVPLGLPGVSFAHALGISMIVGFLTYQPVIEKAKESKTDWSALTLLIARPFLTVGVGYIIHLFM